MWPARMLNLPRRASRPRSRLEGALVASAEARVSGVGGGGGGRRAAALVRGRLALRMGLGLVLGSAAILVAAASWNLRLQRVQLTQLVSASADRVAETIRRSTREAMLR